MIPSYFRFQHCRRPKKITADLIEKITLVYEVYKKWISKYGKKEEWILIFKKQLDRINRIVRIKRPSVEGPLAAGEKNPVNPVNPV